MSEDKTAETKDSRSFEERVFARFDVVEGRLSNVEIRIGKLEDRQYDTKPIWEQALAAIAENNQRIREAFDEIAKTNQLMREGFDEIRAQLGVIVARLDAMDEKFKGIDERFDSLDKDLDNNFRGVERKIDVLNRNILELRADQRYVDSRLEKIESQAKPS
jgi:chromosome segregation ATPase